MRNLTKSHFVPNNHQLRVVQIDEHHQNHLLDPHRLLHDYIILRQTIGQIKSPLYHRTFSYENVDRAFPIYVHSHNHPTFQ